ncbi:MAG TPA: hypothetical protein VFV87_09505 [Pirellulaceae bacterium]|nr:hypothetical protein [Pirellulaceae bacterium]
MSQNEHDHRGSEGSHDHKGEHGHTHRHEHAAPAKPRGLHRDWRLWAAVAAALIAMAVYVLTVDESLSPFGWGPGAPADTPAADAP